MSLSLPRQMVRISSEAISSRSWHGEKADALLPEAESGPAAVGVHQSTKGGLDRFVKIARSKVCVSCQWPN